MRSMRDHGRVARSAEVGPARGAIERGDEFAHGRPDADSLEIRQTDGSMLTPTGPDRMRKGERRDKGRGSSVDRAQETLRGAVNLAAQIMMTAEGLPLGPIASRDAQWNSRPMK